MWGSRRSVPSAPPVRNGYRWADHTGWQPVDRPPPRNAIRGGMTFERCLRARSVPSAPLVRNGGTGGKVSSLPLGRLASSLPRRIALPPTHYHHRAPRVRFASMGRRRSGRGPGSGACLPARRPHKLLPTPAARTGPSIESGGDRSGVGSALLGAVGGSDGTFSVTAPRF